MFRAAHLARVSMAKSLPFRAEPRNGSRGGHFRHENEHLFCVFLDRKTQKSTSFLMYKKGCIVAEFQKLQQKRVLGPPKGDPKPT